jgi:hypothetical protein
MMSHQIAKCGCDCFSCPTYKENLGSNEKRRSCSSGWGKYLNIKLSPEKLRACDGCSIADSERKTYYLNCMIRKCAMVNGIENCAFCSGYPCEELTRTHSVQKIFNRQDFVKQTGKEISEADYSHFIEPYAGLYHLNKVRESLTENQIREYKKFSSKSLFAHFDDLMENRNAFLKIYLLLTSICIEKNISYARFHSLEKKREQLLRILWATGCYGIPGCDYRFLELDSNSFMSLKLQGMYSILTDHLYELRKYDVYGEVVPLIEKGWLTPMGGLRKQGWVFRLKFGESLKGIETLNVFKNYVSKLNLKYGNKSYRIFSRGDLSIMFD